LPFVPRGASVSGSGWETALPDLFLAEPPGRAVCAARRQLVLTVEADVASVEQRLRSGGLVCPFCSGVLAGWGFARPRMLRGMAGLVRVRPRRAASG
jgi:hypothetical protein